MQGREYTCGVFEGRCPHVSPCLGPSHPIWRTLSDTSRAIPCSECPVKVEIFRKNLIPIVVEEDNPEMPKTWFITYMNNDQKISGLWVAWPEDAQEGCDLACAMLQELSKKKVKVSVFNGKIIMERVKE